MLKTVTVFAALAHPITAATIRISLGSFVFTPDTVTAAVGDILEFSFFPVNNSATLSDFGTPCTPAKVGGFHSGFYATSSGQNETSFRVVVNTTEPMFIYCGNHPHCQNGMSAVVNPSDSQTLEAYRLAAKEVDDTVVPESVFGGQLVAASAGSPTPPASNSSGPKANGAVWVGLSGVGAFVAAVMML
ncbi:extracellular serine-rich protein [Podospora aff. communis PSN243]|uniref:Extracellular serine-rich protein n=1 Tax=Podospora aff. communis PSN243 TaxID=3040156 RepID=A0AAV9GFI2_9PEZI|nr:extracellular serine-rich protein [Podospora aff. communis PSN243]